MNDVFVVPFRLAQPLPAMLASIAAPEAAVVSRGPVAAMIERIHAQIIARVARADGPLTIVAGDRLAALAALAGMQRRGDTPALVWLAGDAQMHDARSAPHGAIDAMTLAIATGRAGGSLRTTLGVRPLDDAHIATGSHAVVPAIPALFVVDADDDTMIERYRALGEAGGATRVTLFYAPHEAAMKSLVPLLEAT